ncbi:MAG: MoaD/ThiS family protein [Anaerolineales bacterium]|nr:MoaD/ThiS family protein [Anaerolineales bacterium]
MPVLRIPTPLRMYTNGLNEIDLQGQTVSEAMNDLVVQHPALQKHLFNSEGSLRPFINLFLNDENIHDLQGMDTPLREEDRLLLVPSVAGG